MYDNNAASSSQSDVKEIAHYRYDDDDEDIEVIVIENGNDDRDGYVEVASAIKLLSPLVTIRGFNRTIFWNNVHPSQKLTRNNKNYIHVFALSRYLATYNLSNRQHPSQYYVLKRLISDLIIGAQSQIVDPLSDIKKQLCTIQECVGTGVANNNNNTNVVNMPSSSTSSSNQIYQPTTIPYDNGLSSWTDSMKELFREENSILLANINVSLDAIKTMQADLTNKIAFSNDTMLDSFKSIKDIIIRKK